ncbi:MAG TPA: glycosyltransferase [bacterium]|nr:glycosyltransferase [bacterium]
MSASVENERPAVTVAVVGICSAAHIARCLDALRKQEGAPEFELVVVHDPNIPDVAPLAERYPEARLISNEGQRTPLELASAAMAAARGDLILLTEDHCIPRADWIRVMADAAAVPGRAVVGGRVEIAPGATATDWAFYFVDFFRYASPVREGTSPTLTVCNAAYRRDQVNAIRDIWKTYFHETAINDALSERFGTLWLEPDSEVTMGRHVKLGDAVYERYAFGRLFSCTRIEFVSAGRRLYYTLFSPALPILIMGRMMGKAFRSARLAGAFLRAIVPLKLMVFAWSWGEWLGYVTGKNPRSLVVAPEIRAARRTGS